MASTQQIDFGDIRRFFRRMDSRNIQKVKISGLRKGAVLLRKEMRRLAPKRKGTLRKELVFSVQNERGGTGAIAEVGPSVSAFTARFFEFGTRGPYVIPAKKNQQARNKRIGNTRRTRRQEKLYVKIGSRVLPEVTHPGIKPKPFIRPAFDSAADQVGDSIIDGVWAQIEKEFLK